MVTRGVPLWRASQHGSSLLFLLDQVTMPNYYSFVQGCFILASFNAVLRLNEFSRFELHDVRLLKFLEVARILSNEEEVILIFRIISVTCE